MKVALICGFVLCVMAVILGIAVWFMHALIIEKLVYSILLIASGVAFGAIGIEFWIDA